MAGDNGWQLEAGGNKLKLDAHEQAQSIKHDAAQRQDMAYASQKDFTYKQTPLPKLIHDVFVGLTPYANNSYNATHHQKEKHAPNYS